MYMPHVQLRRSMNGILGVLLGVLGGNGSVAESVVTKGDLPFFLLPSAVRRLIDRRSSSCFSHELERGLSQLDQEGDFTHML